MAAHSSLLRESGRREGRDFDMRVVLGDPAAADGGVEHGALLRRFALAVLGKSDESLAEVRGELLDALDASRAGHAARIVASFDGINRVADATGIRLDSEMAAPVQDLIEELRLGEMLTD